MLNYRSGQVRSGEVRSGQVRSGQVRSRPVPDGLTTRKNWKHVKTLMFWTPTGYQDRENEDRARSVLTPPPKTNLLEQEKLTQQTPAPAVSREMVVRAGSVQTPPTNESICRMVSGHVKTGWFRDTQKHVILYMLDGLSRRRNTSIYMPHGFGTRKNTSFYMPDGLGTRKNTLFYVPDGFWTRKNTSNYMPDGSGHVKIRYSICWMAWRNVKTENT